MISLIGIGQSLRGDDEAGLAAVRLWEQTYRKDRLHYTLRVELVESPGVGLLNFFEGVDAAILVDAVQSGAKPGTLHKLCENDLTAFLDGTDSAHGWGIAETLCLGRKMGLATLPQKIVVIGIEAGVVEVGEGLSPEVAAALPDAVKLISEILEQISAPFWD
jgi:hydrogenase maturation protease